MEISIHHLLSNYCQQLNTTWLEASAQLKEQQCDYTNLKPFIDMTREAKNEGYIFELVFCPLLLLDRSEPNAPFEKSLMELPSWKELNIINTMKEESQRNKWPVYESLLKKLQIEKIKYTAGQFLQSYASKHGPFFISKDPSAILTYCNMGSVSHEVCLLSILQSSISENEI